MVTGYFRVWLTRLALLWPLALAAQPNGKLQIHFIDVGQGDAELLISPGGQTVLIDGGLPGSQNAVKPYLLNHGVTNFDYFVVSHYHNDHIGCAKALLTTDVVSHLKAAYDRGDNPTHTDSYDKTFARNYRSAVQGKRVAASAQPPAAGAGAVHSFRLDANSAQPVEIQFVAVNGNGQITKTGEINENDLSVACLVRFGQFSAVLGGDLSGSNGSEYTDIESTTMAAIPQPVTVYKVHHHGSRYSSNTNWLRRIDPVIGVICCGTRNLYGLPEESALERLANQKVETYWTETGSKRISDPSEMHGAATHLSGTATFAQRLPDPAKHQHVGGNIVVQVAAGANDFQLTTDAPATTTTYLLAKPAGGWGALTSPAPPAHSNFVWSKQGAYYHVPSCSYATLISPKNKQAGPVPPGGLAPHSCVH
jgi:beta-lactamase superfamily II metal-dependent hydrolase